MGSRPHVNKHDSCVQISQCLECSNRQVNVSRPGGTALAAVNNSDEYTFFGTVANWEFLSAHTPRRQILVPTFEEVEAGRLGDPALESQSASE